MANLREQELSLQLCIIAIMQKEELSGSRNRQAAETKGGQNEDQIWQRGGVVAPAPIDAGKKATWSRSPSASSTQEKKNLVS
jgi:hypothetical protein